MLKENSIREEQQLLQEKPSREEKHPNSDEMDL